MPKLFFIRRDCVLAVVVSLWGLGCSDGASADERGDPSTDTGTAFETETGNSGGGDADSNTDVDTDSVVTVDTDVGADSDADTDVDTDADTGTDNNSDKDSDSDTIGAISNTATDSDSASISDSETDSDTDPETAGDSGGEIDSETVDDPAFYLCDVGLYEGGTPKMMNTQDFRVHDPSMIREGDTFYVLWTGEHIRRATSRDLLSWRETSPIYGSYPSWSVSWLTGIPNETFNFPWAPDVSYFGGRYHIYASFSAIFGDNISCITHLTADTMAGPFVDHGPVICTEGNEHYNAIDPDVELDENGTPWMVFGSFWDGIMGFELDLNGNRVGTELIRLAWNSTIEAPVLFRRCGYYYLFVSFGTCCQGANSTYEVRVGRSENAMGPYHDRSGKAMTDGGGTLMVQGDRVNFAAAGHSEVIVVDDTIYHLYHAYRQDNGAAVLRIVALPFDDEGWPVPGGP